MDTRQTKKTAEAASRNLEETLENPGTEVPSRANLSVNPESKSNEWRALCREFNENLNSAVNALATAKKQVAPQLYLYFEKIIPIFNLWLTTNEHETSEEERPLHREFLKYATEVTPTLKAKLSLLKNKGTPSELVFTALDYRSYHSIEQAHAETRTVVHSRTSSEASGSVRSALSNPVSVMSPRSNYSRGREGNMSRGRNRGRSYRPRPRDFNAPYDFYEPDDLIQELRRYRELPPPWNKVPVQSVRKERLDISRQVQLAGDRQFKGNIDDYFKWRDFFIGTLGDVRCYARHKINALRRSLEPVLDSVIDYVSADFEGYREIVTNLEKSYGGTFCQMARYDDYFDSSKFKFGHLDKFRDYSRKVAGYRSLLSSSGDRALFAMPHIYRRLLLPLPSGHIRELQTWLHSGGLESNANNLLHWTRDRLDRLMTEKEVDRSKEKNESGEKSKEKEKKKTSKVQVLHCCAAASREASEPEEYASVDENDSSDSDDTQEATMLYASIKLPSFCMLSCCETHPLPKCPLFLKLDPEQRRSLIALWKILVCYACLGFGHTSRNCRNKQACEVCSTKNHHTLLHLDKKNQVSKDYDTSIYVMFSELKLGKLPFVCVKVSSNNNLNSVPFFVNAIVDTGANVTVISSSLRNRLKSNSQYTPLTLNTAAGPVTKQATIVGFKLWPVDGPPIYVNALSFKTDELFSRMEAWDVKTLTQKYEYLNTINFPPYISEKVDMLLGNDLPGLTSPIKSIRGSSHRDPVAEFCMLGWSLRGPDLPTVNTMECSHDANSVIPTQEWQDVLSRIVRSWEVPEKVEGTYTSPLDKTAGEILERTMHLKDGHVHCGILWSEGHPPVIVNNRPLALRRLNALHTMLDKDPVVCKLYEENIEDWLRDGSLIPVSERATENQVYYLSHFPVIRLNKETTKVRTVVDTSARYRGVCLNDYILPGPNLTNDIRRVLLRFRRRSIAVIGDVRAMFTHIKLLPQERCYHRVLWSPDRDEIQELQFTCFTFGNTCSPAVAMSASRFLTSLFPDDYHRAKEAIIHSTIVDDTLDSVDTMEEAIKLVEGLREIYSKGSMHLHKIGSNNPQVMLAFPENLRSKEVSLSFDLTSACNPRALGVVWNPASDDLLFELSFDNACKTRRQLLSTLARIFDPLGLVAPLLIQLKIIIQRTWMTRMSWDGDLPQELLDNWNRTVAAVSGKVAFPRPLLIRPTLDVSTTSIHIFADASSEAYGAVCYQKTIYNSGETVSQIIMASARVAPVKYTSIPRLELQAAIEAICLAEYLVDSLEVNPYAIHYWTDSTDVLHWIRSASRTLKIFVATRVAQIQSKTHVEKWNWVPTDKNPADLLTRGVKVSVLDDSTLWKNGPTFLCDESQLPISPKTTLSTEASKEKKGNKKIKILITSVQSYWNSKLKKFRCWRRFLCAIVRIIQRIEPKRPLPEICSRALYRTIALLQEELLGTLFFDIKNKKSLPAHNTYSKFRLFYHEETGALHASGRLSHASHLPFLTRFPLFIPEKTHLSTIIIRSIHEQDLKHMGGIKSLTSMVNSTFAIPFLQTQAKRIIRSCVYCKRLSFRSDCPTTAPLPFFRLPLQSRNEVFETSAMDCMGPMFVHTLPQKKATKMYILVVTCTFYRAVHLELIDTLSSDSFLLAFEHFIAVRNRPKIVISDNGRNFLGSWNVLERIFNNLPERLKRRYPTIDWRFNTPLDPHKGGIFERIVGLTKQNLSKILRNRRVTSEQLRTMVKITEAALNNRPLQSGEQDLNDEETLTPNHFIRGSQYNTVSPMTKELDAMKAWKETNDLLSKFWRRFVNQFITGLNIHAKKRFKNVIFKKGQIVLVKDESKMRQDINFPIWPLGKITEVYPGQDGIIRTVKVMVHGKEYLRGTTKVCPLIEADL